MLGAGRMKVDDAIDPKAGIMLKKKVGDAVEAGETLAVLYTDREDVVENVVHRLERAFVVATEPSPALPLIKALIDEGGVHPWHG
jgi:pyrimidine-nucleoside phosphorylase